MLNSSGESGHPCLVPDFRGNSFNFSPLRIVFAVGLSYITFNKSRILKCLRITEMMIPQMADLGLKPELLFPN